MQTLIFLNGKLPKLNIVNKFLKRKSYIIAADGGANKLKKISVIPDIIIGDFDSIHRSTLTYFKNKKSKLKIIKEQDTTDFEKILNYCKDRKLKEIVVLGATSMRPDHTLNNFSVLYRYYKKLNIKLFTDEFEIFFTDKSISFKYKPNETLSLIGIPKADKIITSGLQYKLNKEELEFGIREGTLNKSVSDTVSISFKSGSILIFRKHFIH